MPRPTESRIARLGGEGLPVVLVGDAQPPPSHRCCPTARSPWTVPKALWVCPPSRGSNADKIGSSLTNSVASRHPQGGGGPASLLAGLRAPSPDWTRVSLPPHIHCRCWGSARANSRAQESPWASVQNQLTAADVCGIRALRTATAPSEIGASPYADFSRSQNVLGFSTSK